MQNMRDLLKSNLGRSLEALPPLDRLTAAWPVACGKAMAGRGHILALADGVVTIEVESAVWLDQMRSMRDILQSELARIAQVRIAAIHFEVKGFRREKKTR
jgi:hypothetical protein